MAIKGAGGKGQWAGGASAHARVSFQTPPERGKGVQTAKPPPDGWQEVARKQRRVKQGDSQTSGSQISGLVASKAAKLLESSWPKDAIAQVDTVAKDLDARQSAKGSVAFCGSLAQAENLRRLAALQQCNTCKFAPLAVVSRKQKEVPSGAVKVLLPFWDSGQVILSETFVFPLGQKLPSTLPKQAVRATKVAAEAPGLAVFRVLAPEVLLPKESWQAAKENPRQALRAWGAASVPIHSTYGWKILEDGGKSGSELVLEGFLRVKEGQASQVSKLSGSVGLFTEAPMCLLNLCGGFHAWSPKHCCSPFVGLSQRLDQLTRWPSEKVAPMPSGFVGLFGLRLKPGGFQGP